MDMTELNKIRQEITDNFNANLEEVNKLLNFDTNVLENVIEKLNGLHNMAIERLKLHENHDFMKKMVNTTKEIENIRDHGSVNQCYYSTINNQCVVLLVSHFSATLHDLFRKVIEVYINNSFTEHLDDVAKIEFTVKELIDHKQDEKCIGDIILDKDKTKSVNFQDMKSTKRVFDSCFQINLLKNISVHEENVIFAQTARHNIVHNGAIVNQQFITRIKAASGRNLKQDVEFEDGQVLKFNQDEIEILENSMKEFVSDIFNKIEVYFKNKKETASVICDD